MLIPPQKMGQKPMVVNSGSSIFWVSQPPGAVKPRPALHTLGVIPRFISFPIIDAG